MSSTKNPPTTIAPPLVDEDGDADGAADYRWLLSENKSQPALVRGSKDFAPDGSERQAQALTDARDALCSVLQEERRASNRSLSQAIWLPSQNLARVTVQKGTAYQNMGTTVGGETFLLPEEVLFMVERNTLLLTHCGGLLSVQHAFNLLLGKGAPGDERLDVDVYLVYAFLKRLGYAVFRSERRLAPPTINRGIKPHSPLGLFEVVRHTITNTIGSFVSLVGRLLTRWLPFWSCAPSWPLCDLTSRRYRYVGQVFRSLQIIPRQPISHSTSPTPPLSTSPPMQHSNPLRHQHRSVHAFDVFKPRPRFRKSDPGPPDFFVVAQRVFDPLPDMHTLRGFLAQTSPTTQLKIAVTDSGNVSFLAFSEPPNLALV
ncbi:hypothetical protein DFJ77DRAFT_478860 [Powellomyces hirtus]|nr:hypothetical protein DFJ77DRAFT_478860 [Powellomyces hirtus]